MARSESLREGEIRRAMREPPADTRAWARTMLCAADRARRDRQRQLGQRSAFGSAPPAAQASKTIRFDDPRRFTKG